ncbi:MAG: hypothetical protein K9H25_11380 [Rhodospirillum sp.]|nr:hypothetical protein [Rhodospirillum sp.]MCF8489844.1 hypothetical protein [Rhodospirillum sp.]MCF8499661.1 hypothetical protein [Rhodospirillum sp.]
MRAVAAHTLACLRRDPAPPMVAGLVLATALIGAFLGKTTLVEGHDSALILAGSGARLALVGGLATLVTTHLDRLRQGRELERLATLPLSPLALMAGLWLGWLPLALALAVLVGGLLLWLGASGPGLAAWTTCLAVEGAVIVALALFSGITLRRGVALAATLCLYAFARLSGLFLAIAHHRAEGAGLAWSEPLLTGLALVVPRLDLFGQSAWLTATESTSALPGPWAALGLLAQGGGAIVLALVLGSWDLRRSVRA